MEVLRGRPVAQRIDKELKLLSESIGPPTLVVYLVGGDESSAIYARSKVRKGEKIGARVILREYASSVTQDELEMEISSLDSTTATAFRADFGLVEPGLERIIRLSYELLGLVTFFTIVSDEFRAWSIPNGTNALDAAGRIHSDMERGFIRAEVVSCPDLLKHGSLAGVRQHGLLRLEGKKYIVQDGDVITFLFNV